MESKNDNETTTQISTNSRALHHDDDTGNIIEDTESQEESQIHNENLICRFYRKDFPEENDIVIVSNLKPNELPFLAYINDQKMLKTGFLMIRLKLPVLMRTVHMLCCWSMRTWKVISCQLRLPRRE